MSQQGKEPKRILLPGQGIRQAAPIADMAGNPPMVLVRQRVWREPCSKCGGAQIYDHRINDVGKESVDQYVCKQCGHGRIVITAKTAVVKAVVPKS
jgi:predicted RNA-binding Zn-ribbon protein involved in translation (DUF1610 family)